MTKSQTTGFFCEFPVPKFLTGRQTSARKNLLAASADLFEFTDLTIQVERSNLGLFIAGKPDRDVVISVTTD